MLEVTTWFLVAPQYLPVLSGRKERVSSDPFRWTSHPCMPETEVFPQRVT